VRSVAGAHVHAPPHPNRVIRIRRKSIALALQGGGSHGAYTWGVLDRLLEEDHLDIDAISGASAGAMNAAVLAHGMTSGGRDGARAALDRFWRRISTASGLFAAWESAWQDETPALRALTTLSTFLSPAQLNPLALNPLREILAEELDIERIRTACPTDLFISATQVRTGSLRVFDRSELTLDVLLASACLPRLHPPVAIQGEAYWDGGLSANPAVLPLLEQPRTRDIVFVTLLPARQASPTTVCGISQRLSEIAFGSAFLAELRWLALAKRIAGGRLFGFGVTGRLKRLSLHVIDGGSIASGLGPHSQVNTARSFLERLRARGHADTDAWLHRNYGAIGRRSTVALESYLQPATAEA